MILGRPCSGRAAQEAALAEVLLLLSSATIVGYVMLIQWPAFNVHEKVPVCSHKCFFYRRLWQLL